jgi:hypothetical protein
MSDKPSGKGTLILLDELKEKWGPMFKAQTPKSKHKINQECADLACPHLADRVEIRPGGVWYIKSVWCTEKDCPREK